MGFSLNGNFRIIFSVRQFKQPDILMQAKFFKEEKNILPFLPSFVLFRSPSCKKVH